MIPFVATLLAFADPGPEAKRPAPPSHKPVSVQAVPWAQPFTLASPMEWTMGRDRRPVDAGWLVELRAPAELLVQRAVGQQVLFANAVPVRPLHAPLVAPCTVVVVPQNAAADADLADVRFYFGSTELPERMDAVHGQWELAVAVDAGVEPVAPDVVAPKLALEDLTELAERAQARFEQCRAPDAPEPVSNTL